MPHLVAQCSRFSKSFCSFWWSSWFLMFLYSRQSSANHLTDEVTASGRSFMWHKNMIGPNILPPVGPWSPLMFLPIALLRRLFSLCLPHEMGRHTVFSSVVRLSVRPSVRLSVRHTFVSALYVLNPWWDFQITLHKCQVWWEDVQCLCLTKVGSRSRSQFKILTLYDCISCPLYIFWTPGGIYK